MHSSVYCSVGISTSVMANSWFGGRTRVVRAEAAIACRKGIVSPIEADWWAMKKHFNLIEFASVLRAADA